MSSLDDELRKTAAGRTLQPRIHGERPVFADIDPRKARPGNGPQQRRPRARHAACRHRPEEWAPYGKKKGGTRPRTKDAQCAAMHCEGLGTGSAHHQRTPSPHREDLAAGKQAHTHPGFPCAATPARRRRQCRGRMHTCAKRKPQNPDPVPHGPPAWHAGTGASSGPSCLTSTSSQISDRMRPCTPSHARIRTALRPCGITQNESRTCPWPRPAHATARTAAPCARMWAKGSACLSARPEKSIATRIGRPGTRSVS